MSVPMEEQETVIQIDRNGVAKIWTSDTTVMTKLDKLYFCTKEGVCENKVFSKQYVAPRKCISFRSDPNQKPNYVPKLNAKHVDALRKGRQQRKN